MNNAEVAQELEKAITSGNESLALMITGEIRKRMNNDSAMIQTM